MQPFCPQDLAILLLPNTGTATMSVAEELQTIATRLQLVSDELHLIQAVSDEQFIRLFAQSYALTDEEFSRRLAAGICINCTRDFRAYGESPEPGYCSLCYMGRADSDGERIPEEEDEEEEQEQEEEEAEEEDDEEEQEEDDKEEEEEDKEKGEEEEDKMKEEEDDEEGAKKRRRTT